MRPTRIRETIMKQKSINFSLVVLATLIIVSCYSPTPTIQVTQKLRYREASGRNIEPAQNAVIVPMVAHLDVITDNRIEYVETFDDVVNLDVINNISMYKKIALLNATKKYNADTMVAALINVDTTESGHLVITVLGYPARYKDFRSMTPDDQWVLDIKDNNHNKSTEIIR